MPVEIVTPKSVREAVGDLPSVAWPTLLLLISCVFIEIFVMYLLNTSSIPPLLGVCINTIVIFVSFTPMHEASHSSVGLTRLKFLNPLTGWVAGSCFPMPFPAFKTMHLLHHKHTNEPEDPDLWAGSGPALLLPLRWLTIEFKYYVHYLPTLPSRPLKESMSTVMYLLGMVFFIRNLLSGPLRSAVLLGWLLPGRLALVLLSYFFDYLPHRPHVVSGRENQHEATAVTELYEGDERQLLTWPLLQQNYHNIHHLAPYVPFYLYAPIWRKYKSDLIKAGTEVRTVFGFDREKATKKAEGINRRKEKKVA